jgi:1-acyl-sn-glycerol-3-phosphate acyltransferase
LQVLSLIISILFLSQGSFDRSAIRTSINILENGKILGVFPEGGRSVDGILRKGQRGAGLIALLSGSPVLPLAISNTNLIVQKPRKRMYFPKNKADSREAHRYKINSGYPRAQKRSRPYN